MTMRKKRQQQSYNDVVDRCWSQFDVGDMFVMLMLNLCDVELMSDKLSL